MNKKRKANQPKHNTELISERDLKEFTDSMADQTVPQIIEDNNHYHKLAAEFRFSPKAASVRPRKSELKS